jgi:hypothetical protein
MDVVCNKFTNAELVEVLTSLNRYSSTGLPKIIRQAHYEDVFSESARGHERFLNDLMYNKGVLKNSGSTPCIPQSWGNREAGGHPQTLPINRDCIGAPLFQHLNKYVLSITQMTNQARRDSWTI